jgi:hypothetical protein
MRLYLGEGGLMRRFHRLGHNWRAFSSLAPGQNLEGVTSCVGVLVEGGLARGSRWKTVGLLILS